jgi:hypothetical protein
MTTVPIWTDYETGETYCLTCFWEARMGGARLRRSEVTPDTVECRGCRQLAGAP